MRLDTPAEFKKKLIKADIDVMKVIKETAFNEGREKAISNPTVYNWLNGKTFGVRRSTIEALMIAFERAKRK